METILVQINDSKAYRILRDLEDLKIIRVLKTDRSSSRKLSERYAGSLSVETTDKLNAYLNASRDEWNHRGI